MDPTPSTYGFSDGKRFYLMVDVFVYSFEMDALTSLSNSKLGFGQQVLYTRVNISDFFVYGPPPETAKDHDDVGSGGSKGKKGMQEIIICD